MKMVADTILHPGSDLPEPMGRYFLERMSLVLTKIDHGFPARFQMLFPLYSLTWILILLNEFLPERWERRNLGGRNSDREAVCARQLSRARHRLERLRMAHDAR